MKRGLKLAAAAVLSVMCALCFAFGVSAIAAQPEDGGAKSLSIDYANLKFEDNVYLLYAAGSENIEDTSSIKLLVWESVPEEYSVEGNPDYTLDVYNHQEINGVTYPVFCFTELAAKQMTDDVYVCAYYDDNGTPVYSEPFKYSILQYAYNMLNGGTEDYMLQDLLYSMLKYGRAAQYYFNYNTERPADGEYVNVKVNGGTLSDGFTYGLYLRDSEVLFTAPAEKDGCAFSHWIDNYGRTYGDGEPTFVYYVGENMTMSAVYEGLTEIIDIELPSEILLSSVDNTEVFVRYNDRSYKIISPRELDVVSGSVNWDAAGTYTFTAEYEGFTKQFTVTIVDPADRVIISIYIKDTYLGDDPIVSIEYNVGGSEDTTLSAMIEAGFVITDTNTGAPFDHSSAAPGEYNLYIEYNGSGAEAHFRLIDPNDTTINNISCESFIVTVGESGELTMLTDGALINVYRNNNTTSYVPLTEDMISYDEAQIKEIAQYVLDTGEPTNVVLTITYEEIKTESKVVLMPETTFANGDFGRNNSQFVYFTEDGYDSGYTIYLNRSEQSGLSGWYIRHELEIFGYYAVYYESVKEVYDESGENTFDVFSCDIGYYNITVKSTFNQGWQEKVNAWIFTEENVFYRGRFSGGSLALNAGATEEEAIRAATEIQATLSKVIEIENNSMWESEASLYLTAEMIDFSGVNLNTVGEQNFTVTYNGTEYTFTVTVLPGGEECLFTNVVMGLKQSDALIDEEGHYITVTMPYGEKRVFTYEATATPNVIKVNMGDGYPLNYYYIDGSGNKISLYPWQLSVEPPAGADGVTVFTLNLGGGSDALISLVDIGEDGIGYAEMYMFDGSEYLLAYTLDATVTYDGEGNVTGGSAFGMEFIVRGTALIPAAPDNFVACTVTYISIGAIDTVGYLDEENRMLVVYTDSGTAEYSFEYLNGYNNNVITLFSPGTDIPTLYAYIDRTFPDALLIMPWVSPADWNEDMGFPQEPNASEHIYTADLSGEAALVAFIHDDINGGYYAVIYRKMPELGEEGYIPFATVAATVETDENGAFTSVNFMDMNFTVQGNSIVLELENGESFPCTFVSGIYGFAEKPAELEELDEGNGYLTVNGVQYKFSVFKEDVILLDMRDIFPIQYYYIDRSGKIPVISPWHPSGEIPSAADGANNIYWCLKDGEYFLLKLVEIGGGVYCGESYTVMEEGADYVLFYTMEVTVTMDESGVITGVSFYPLDFVVQGDLIIDAVAQTERCLFTSHAETFVGVKAILNETECTVTVIEWAKPIVYTYELTDKTDIILLHMGGDSPDNYYFIDRSGEVITLCSWHPSGETPSEPNAANNVFLLNMDPVLLVKITDADEDGKRYVEMYRGDYIEPVEENVWLLAYTLDAEVTTDDTGAITEVTFEGMTFAVQGNELIPQA